MIIFLIICYLKLICCNNFDDGVIYNVSLKNLNPTLKNSELFSSQNVLYSNSTITISITDISPSLGFLIVQTHSYKYNLTLSYKRNLDIRYHINGTNIGLAVENSTSKLLYVSNYGINNISFYFSVHAYYKHAPIPGGCNMEFNMIDAPFMELWHDLNMIRVDASQARVSVDGDCDVGSVNVTHEFYKMFLPEWDRSEKEYFEGLKKMLTVENITKYGSHVPVISSYALMRRYFSLYPGTGSFYVIIAKNRNMSSAYVPIHTYGCDDCAASWFDILYLVLITIIGLSICFLGFLLYPFQFYVFGLILLMAYFYTLVHFITTSFFVISVFFGVAFCIFAICNFIPMPIPAMFILGFQIACIFCHAIPEDVLTSEIYFWSILLSVTFTVTLLPLFDYGYYIACSVVGSFCLTILFDSLLGSYLRYIILNVLRRITVTNFNIANIQPPYQWRDAIVSVTWVVLAFLGMFLHICSVKKMSFTSEESITFYGAMGREPRDSREPRMPRMPRMPREPRQPRHPRVPRQPRK